MKVIDTDWDEVFDSPGIGTDAIVARGIRYAVDNGVRVLNLSIGRDGAPAPVIRDAMQYVVSHGAFVVVAAVGAVGHTGGRAYYSNTGPYLELMAPGGDERRNGTIAGV